MKLALIALSVLASACGGMLSGGDDGGVDSSGPWSPVCPQSEPSQGSSCSHDALECEYGCGNVVVCSSGTWAGAVNFGNDVTCDAGPNPKTCPSAFSSITQGATCAFDGTTCIYGQGVCQCSSPADPTPDAGASWFCGPEPGCPMPRPRIGSACTTPNLTCDYQQCGNSIICKDSVWQGTFAGCGA